MIDKGTNVQLPFVGAALTWEPMNMERQAVRQQAEPRELLELRERLEPRERPEPLARPEPRALAEPQEPAARPQAAVQPRQPAGSPAAAVQLRPPAEDRKQQRTGNRPAPWQLAESRSSVAHRESVATQEPAV